MPETVSEPEPSETLKAHPSLLECYESGNLPLEECERRAQGAERLKGVWRSPGFVGSHGLETSSPARALLS